MNGYSTSVYSVCRQMESIASCFILFLLPLTIVCTFIQHMAVHIYPNSMNVMILSNSTSTLIAWSCCIVNSIYLGIFVLITDVYVEFTYTTL